MSSSSPDVSRDAARQQALHLLNTPPMGQPSDRRWRKMAALGLGMLLLSLTGILTGSVFFSRSVTPAPVVPVAASSSAGVLTSDARC